MAANFANYWRRLTGANKSLSDEENRMSISVASVKSQLEKAYKAGAEDGAKMVRDFRDVGSDRGFGDIFGDLWK